MRDGCHKTSWPPVLAVHFNIARAGSRGRSNLLDIGYRSFSSNSRNGRTRACSRPVRDWKNRVAIGFELGSSAGAIGLSDIDFALEVGTLFNGHSLSDHVAYGDRGFSEVHPLRGIDVAFQFALHDYGFGAYVGAYLPVRTNRQTVALKVDTAFDLAIDIKIFAARKVSFDNDRFTDMRKLRRLRRVHDVASLGLAYRGTQAGILDSKSLCDLTGSQKNTGE